MRLMILFQLGALGGGGGVMDAALARYSGAPLLRRNEKTSLFLYSMAYLRAVFPTLHCRGWVRGRQAKACGAPALPGFGRHVSLAFHQQLHYSDTTIVCGVDERGAVTVGVGSKKNWTTTEKNAK